MEVTRPASIQWRSKFYLLMGEWQSHFAKEHMVLIILSWSSLETQYAILSHQTPLGLWHELDIHLYYLNPLRFWDSYSGYFVLSTIHNTVSTEGTTLLSLRFTVMPLPSLHKEPYLTNEDIIISSRIFSPRCKEVPVMFTHMAIWVYQVPAAKSKVWLKFYWEIITLQAESWNKHNCPPPYIWLVQVRHPPQIVGSSLQIQVSYFNCQGIFLMNLPLIPRICSNEFYILHYL